MQVIIFKLTISFLTKIIIIWYIIVKSILFQWLGFCYVCTMCLLKLAYWIYIYAPSNMNLRSQLNLWTCTWCSDLKLVQDFSIASMLQSTSVNRLHWLTLIKQSAFLLQRLGMRYFKNVDPVLKCIFYYSLSQLYVR